MSTVADQLRAFADQLEELSRPTGILPLPAAGVKVGDLVRRNVDETLRVDGISVANTTHDVDLLRFEGVYVRSPEYQGVDGTHLAYANEYVVIER